MHRFKQGPTTVRPQVTHSPTASPHGEGKQQHQYPVTSSDNNNNDFYDDDDDDYISDEDNYSAYGGVGEVDDEALRGYHRGALWVASLRAQSRAWAAHCATSSDPFGDGLPPRCTPYGKPTSHPSPPPPPPPSRIPDPSSTYFTDSFLSPPPTNYASAPTSTIYDDGLRPPRCTAFGKRPGGPYPSTIYSTDSLLSPPPTN